MSPAHWQTSTQKVLQNKLFWIFGLRFGEGQRKKHSPQFLIIMHSTQGFAKIRKSWGGYKIPVS
ncbi:MAG: hypothetical protein DRJ05_06970 [Bacteroidetes bacterium]|nr:MAG: hypothetical protein DRJ05_06970 [Bacteroidota bacterium]